MFIYYRAVIFQFLKIENWLILAWEALLRPSEHEGKQKPKAGGNGRNCQAACSAKPAGLRHTLFTLTFLLAVALLWA